MQRASDKYLAYLDAMQDMMRDRIRNTETKVKYKGTAYYVSENGNDDNDGLTPDTPWKTPEKVSTATLSPGDAVFFKEGKSSEVISMLKRV